MAVLAKAGRPWPRELQAARRCAYFGRFCRHAPPSLRALVQANANAPGSWRDATVAAIDWMRERVRQLSGMPPPGEGMTAWARLAADHPAAWSAFMKRAILVARQHAEADARRQRWEAEVASALAMPGVQLPEGRQEPTDQGVPCYECGEVFRPRKALVLHAFRVHERKALVRLLVPGDTCAVCLQCFSTRPRYIAHVAYHSQVHGGVAEGRENDDRR